MKNYLILFLLAAGLAACTCKDAEPVIGEFSEVMPATPPVVIAPVANQTASTDYTLAPSNRLSVRISFDRPMNTTTVIPGATLVFFIPDLSQELPGTISWQSDSSFTYLSDPLPNFCLLPNDYNLQLIIVGNTTAPLPTVADTQGIALDGDQDGNAGGNFTTQFLLVQDKPLPSCLPPADVTTFCDDLPMGFDPSNDAQLSQLFGDAVAIDSCGATTTQISKSIDWNCDSGVIVRTFEATDAFGQASSAPCNQTIVVHPVHNYEIKFPRDIQVDCMDPVPDLIETTELACDLLSVTAFDELQPGSGGACYQLKRTYRVANWCEYDGSATAVIISRDADCDDLMGEEDVYVLRRPDFTFLDQDNNEAANPAVSPCGNGASGHYGNSDLNPGLISSGLWEYDQIISVVDDTPPLIQLTGETSFCSFNNITCDAPFEITFELLNDCAAGGDITLNAFVDGGFVAIGGAYPFFSVSGQEMIGNHGLEIFAVDACGNIESLFVPFRIIDCEPPSPVCLNGLTVELAPAPLCTAMGIGSVTVQAGDFVVSNPVDCSGPVTLSINQAGDPPDPMQSGLTLTFDDIGVLPIEIYAWDSANNPTAVQPGGAMGGPNYSYCATSVTVQDNLLNTCGIAGWINDRNSLPVEYVQVTLSGNTTDVDNTGVNGFYEFCPLDEGGDYTVTPFRDDNPLNGVSNLDLALLADHITGASPLTSPYQLIAADVNNSGTVTTADYIELQQLIMNIIPSFPNNTSWRFIDACYQFPVSNNPWFEAFPEVKNYSNLQLPITPDGFIGIKIGDLNGDAMPNSQASISQAIAYDFQGALAEQISPGGWETETGFRPERSFDLEDFNQDPSPLSLDRKGLEANGFLLEQNAPNPWSERTRIGFYLPEAGAVRLTIHDVRGQVLQVIHTDGVAGYNQLELNEMDVGPASGVLYYTLKTSRFQAARKMIWLRKD